MVIVFPEGQPSGAARLENTVHWKAELILEQIDAASGELLHRSITPNLLVNAGKNLLAQRLGSNGVNAVSHCAVGTSSTAAAAGDTALGGEVARVALDGPSYPGTGQIRWTCTFGATVGNGQTWKEVGLLNATSAGTLVNRFVLAVANQVTKNTSTIVNVTVTVTIS